MVLDSILDPFLPELISKPIKNYIVLPIKRQFSHAFECDSTVEKLQEQTELLANKRIRLQQSVDEATRNGEHIHENVINWLSTAETEIQEAEQLIQNKEAKKKICVGLFPNLKTRYQLSKKADKKAVAIEELLNEKEIHPISFRPPLQQIVEPSVYSRESLPSRVLMLNQVMDALKDPNLNMIGVYGMGGVGKTTLAKEVQRKAVEDKLFDSVVMVAVSQTPDLKRIQGEIADFLNMKFDAEEVPGRASQLYARLKNSKVLIILDDIWAKLELRSVGIPFGDESKGSRILLFSRSKDVLSCKMGTQKDFPLEVLGEEEGLSLFYMTITEARNPELQAIAIEIAKKCAGLPLLIIIVATDLKNKGSFAWRDTLKQLSDFGSEELHQRVHIVLRSSYENLHGKELKSFFLLCAFFGQSNIPINHLLAYAMGLGLFRNIVGVQDARDRLFRMIEKLKIEGLLLEGDMNGHVKMHDVVLDFAFSIATEEHRAFFGVSGHELREWPAKDCTRVVLPYCDIDKLPQDLEYPETELFSLFTEDILIMPDLFFEGFRKLRVLNLRGICFMSLPSSLHFLTNLHSLHLDRCQLGDVAIIGDLKQLKFLSFAGSRIIELPRKMEQLSQLKLLDLSNCSQLNVIPTNVLSKLSLLEELYMIDSFVRWDEEGKASVMELDKLCHLTTLEIKLNDASRIPNRLFSKGLLRYRIFIGDGGSYNWFKEYETTTMLKLCLQTSIQMEHGLKELLRRTEILHLDEVRGIANWLYDIDGEGCRQLKHLLINNDDGIRHIIKSTMWDQCPAFPILETLFLYNLNSLEDICHGQLATSSFSKLRILNVSGCHKLKNIFSYSFAKCLSQLQKMEVRNCNNMEAIIDEGNEDEVIELTQLSSLKLQNLPRLISIFGEKVSFFNLTSLWVDSCNNLKYICKTAIVKSLLQLKRLDIIGCHSIKEIILIEKIEEEKSIDKIVFLNLDILYLRSLPNLIRFSGDYSIEFPSLRKMTISNCDVLKNLVSHISNRGNNSDIQSLFSDMVTYSNLKIMDVFEMKNLEHIWQPSVVKRFQRLEDLTITNCPKIQEIYQLEELNFNEVITFELRHLMIGQMDSLKHIWRSEDGDELFKFQNLKSVEVRRCEVMKYVFPASIAKNLLQLEKLDVEYCGELENIVGRLKSGEVQHFKFYFPELNFLRLNVVWAMKSFNAGIHISEWPKLKYLELRKCNEAVKLLDQVSPNLETLILEGKNLKAIPVEYFSRLKKIEVHDFRHGDSGLLRALHSLQILILTHDSPEEQFIDRSLEEQFLLYDERPVILQLKCLELRNLVNLKHIWMLDSPRCVPQYLQTLNVQQCGSLKNIAASSVSLHNLTTLHISFCENLENLVTPSIAKIMVQLMELRITSCKMMKEIVAKDGDDAEHDEIIFKQLKYLYLGYLPRLNSFCSGNYTFNFPLLRDVIVKRCSLKIFCDRVLHTPKLRKVVYEEALHWEGNLNATIASQITKSEAGMPLEPRLFFDVRSLSVEQISSFSKAIPASQLQFLNNLMHVNVRDCDSVQVVFDLEGVYVEDGDARLLPQLENLELINLPMLSQLWNKDPVGILDFSNLIWLIIENCNSLKYAFTPSTASCLIQLQKIEIKNCKMMEAIINQEEAEETILPKMKFPSLKSVALQYLPIFSSIYLGIGILECPSLEEMTIYNCPSIKEFISALSWEQIPTTHDEGRGQILGMQKLHQVSPNLEKLILDGRTLKAVHCNQFAIAGFFRLKVMELHCLSDGDSGFLREYFYSLEKLVLKDSSLEELFLSNDERIVREGQHVTAILSLQHLELYRLPNLKYICKEDSPVVQYLQKLIIQSCGSLKNIAATSVSFQNLTTLHVSYCKKLENLVTPSTAKTLVQLMELHITNCKMMKEIVAKDEDDTEHEIVFSQLKYLELVFLPTLNSFCSGNYTFHFPSLQQVIVKGCLQMKTFCVGVLSTPKLQDIEYTIQGQSKICWEGNLNATIASLVTKRDLSHADEWNIIKDCLLQKLY